MAGEVRAEAARRGLTHRDLARRLHVSHTWVARRIGMSADVNLTLEDVDKLAEALEIAPQRLYSILLPRLDSNQQPSG